MRPAGLHDLCRSSSAIFRPGSGGGLARWIGGLCFAAPHVPRRPLRAPTRHQHAGLVRAPARRRPPSPRRWAPFAGVQAPDHIRSGRGGCGHCPNWPRPRVRPSRRDGSRLLRPVPGDVAAVRGRTCRLRPGGAGGFVGLRCTSDRGHWSSSTATRCGSTAASTAPSVGEDGPHPFASCPGAGPPAPRRGTRRDGLGVLLTLGPLGLDAAAHARRRSRARFLRRRSGGIRDHRLSESWSVHGRRRACRPSRHRPERANRGRRSGSSRSCRPNSSSSRCRRTSSRPRLAIRLPLLRRRSSVAPIARIRHSSLRSDGSHGAHSAHRRVRWARAQAQLAVAGRDGSGRRRRHRVTPGGQIRAARASRRADRTGPR
mmetsp:Transcript_59140/g.158233  ORF Transcript_59140/g.158233 Transcript_59140/m.158233 type:complete len:372 (-) Transcript_59140:1256-2371(-)